MFTIKVMSYGGVTPKDEKKPTAYAETIKVFESTSFSYDKMPDGDIVFFISKDDSSQSITLQSRQNQESDNITGNHSVIVMNDQGQTIDIIRRKSLA